MTEAAHLRPYGTVPRRLDGPPRPIEGELIRVSLVEELAGRWETPVTTVVAGAGFGKTTALAQMVRLHRANPQGIEAWVTCEPGDEDADRLSAAICRALGAGATEEGPTDAVWEALLACSPLPSCLILDDLHELPAGSSGHRLVADLVRRLPARSHLVLVGRAVGNLPLARLRAAGQVRCLGESDLGFSAPELALLASRAGRAATDLSGLGGWPALVRLTLSAPPGVARGFLWEEVVCALTDAERKVLLSLAVLGAADTATLTALAGVPVDLDALTERIPLVQRVSEDTIGAHPLWEEALDRLLPGPEVAAARARAADLLLRRGEALRAGTVAIAAGDLDWLARAATVLVQETAATFPNDTGRRWLAAVPPQEAPRPGLLLLDAATRQAGAAADPDVDRLVDAAGAAARAAGDLATEVAALSLATVAAYLRGDEQRLFELFQRAVDLPESDAVPILRVLKATAHAAMAELFGTVDDGIAALQSLPDSDIARDPSKSVVRLHVHLLLLAGRADEAAALAERHLALAPYAHVRRLPVLARWMAGDPADLLRGPSAPHRSGELHTPDADANARFRLNFLAYGVVIAASLGDHVGLRTLGAQLRGAGPGTDRRDEAMLAVAAAAAAVADGDEPAAERAIVEFITLHPLSDPVVSIHLRRFLAYGYVLSEQARQAWDAEPLGAAHQRVRDIARALLAARKGQPIRRVPDPASVVTALPLPWSVELAAYAQRAGAPGGLELLRWLTDHVGAPVHEQLRAVADRPAGAARDGARLLLALVPAAPACRTRVELLGPLRLLVDGRPVAPVQLRRGRVRQLLVVLAVLGEVDRSRLMGLLWPDLDPDAAARNLRVTLTYLRQALEPQRRGGDPGHHVRVSADRVSLVTSATLEIDLTQTHDHLVRARRAVAQRDPGAVEEHLGAAMRLWRGEPLTDLSGVAALQPQVTALLAELTWAALTLGERRLAEGDTAEAQRCAERALDCEPYAERGLRLLLAVELQRADPHRIRLAAERVRGSLAELDVPPEPATEMVLRQASAASRLRNRRLLAS